MRAILLVMAGLAVGCTKLATAPAKPTASPQDAKERDQRMDFHGDGLPPGARARMGSVRFRHGGKVLAVRFSPDGKILASGSEDSSVRLWDPTTGKELLKLDGHRFPVESVGFSPDGGTLASVGRDGAICLWELPNGRLLRRVNCHERAITSVSFSPDGQLLATGSLDLTVRLSEVATLREVRRLDEFRRGVLTVRFSPNGKLLATGDGGGGVHLWEVATGGKLRELRGHGAAVRGVEFTADGKTLASGGQDTAIRLWDVETGQERCKLWEPMHYVSAIAFSPDGRTLFSGSRESILLWSTETGKKVGRFFAYGWVRSLAVSPDGAVLAVGSDDWRVGLRSIATGAELAKPLGHRYGIWSVAVSPDGRKLASASADSTVRVWELATGRELLILKGHCAEVRAVAFARGGRAVVSVGDDRNLRRWDSATGERLGSFHVGEGIAHGGSSIEGVWFPNLSTVAFSSDGAIVATGGGGLVQAWDVNTAEKTFRLQMHEWAGDSAIGIPPEGTNLVTADDSVGDVPCRAIHVWDLASGDEVQRLLGYCGQILSVVFSPDGRGLAAAIVCDAHMPEVVSFVRMWDQETGELVLMLGRHSVQVTCAAFAPDGKTLATADENGTIQLWEIATAGRILERTGHQGQVECLAFSPDGRFLISGSRDGTALVWTLEPPATDLVVLPSDTNTGAIDILWERLAECDAGVAHRAIWRLTGRPARAIPFLERRLEPPTPKDLEDLLGLVAQLGHDDHAVRRRAFRELAKLGEQARPTLLAGIERYPSAEVRISTRSLLALLDPEVGKYSGEILRQTRAIRALEWIGTQDAREVLQNVANTSPWPLVETDAKAALKRLEGRGVK